MRSPQQLAKQLRLLSHSTSLHPEQAKTLKEAATMLDLKDGKSACAIKGLMVSIFNLKAAKGRHHTKMAYDVFNYVSDEFLTNYPEFKP